MTTGPDRVVWLGHATVVLELDGVRLITDPVLTMRLLHLRRQQRPPRAEAFRHVDAVLISHLHYDHLHLPSLRRIGRAAPLVVPRGSGRMLTRSGFTDVTEIAPGETIEVGAVTVEAVHAEHDEHRRPGGPTAPPLGFVVGDARPVYFAGDTAVFDGMAQLAGRVDVALLPVWGWGPTLGPGHMDPREAARALALVQPAVAVPIHWGTLFPAGLAGLRRSPLRDPPRAFVRRAADLAPSVRVEVLAPGQALALDPAGCGHHPS